MKIDLDKLPPAAAKRVKLAMQPRDGSLALHFSKLHISAWKQAARSAGKKLSTRRCGNDKTYW